MGSKFWAWISRKFIRWDAHKMFTYKKFSHKKFSHKMFFITKCVITLQALHSHCLYIELITLWPHLELTANCKLFELPLLWISCTLNWLAFIIVYSWSCLFFESLVPRIACTLNCTSNCLTISSLNNFFNNTIYCSNDNDDVTSLMSRQMITIKMMKLLCSWVFSSSGSILDDRLKWVFGTIQIKPTKDLFSFWSFHFNLPLNQWNDFILKVIKIAAKKHYQKLRNKLLENIFYVVFLEQHSDV